MECKLRPRPAAITTSHPDDLMRRKCTPGKERTKQYRKRIQQNPERCEQVREKDRERKWKERAEKKKLYETDPQEQDRARARKRQEMQRYRAKLKARNITINQYPKKAKAASNMHVKAKKIIFSLVIVITIKGSCTMLEKVYK